MANIQGTNTGVIPLPVVATNTAVNTNVPTAGVASNRKGYYYLCPVNKGWWTQSNGFNIGGLPMRGFTIQNTGISPFIPDGDLNDADIVYASNSSYNQIGLIANAGTNTARFAIVDLYGIIIPSAQAGA